jgi:hypothetical protein
MQELLADQEQPPRGLLELVSEGCMRAMLLSMAARDD